MESPSRAHCPDKIAEEKALCAGQSLALTLKISLSTFLILRAYRTVMHV